MPDHEILTAEAHRDMRVRTDRAVELGDAVMCCMTVPSEFRDDVMDDDAATLLAMFGFEQDENLFLDNGRWDARYVPLAIDIQPFLIGTPADDAGAKQIHIDMASPRIGGDEGVRLFDEDGRPTPYLESIADQLGALAAGYQASGDFFAALRRHDLLEPFALEITLDDGSTNRLVGFHIIDEGRLQALDADALGELHAEDHLMHIFMALASLGNLSELIARKNRRVGDG